MRRSSELGAVQPNARQFQLFVYGHTHQAEDVFTPMEGTLDNWRPSAINTGAWHRVIHPADLEKWRGNRTHASVLSAQPSALPACYSFVAVPPYDSKPVARLQYWTQTAGRWSAADACSSTTPQ
jgi:hypothetical protein